ncbi:DUF2851 family protein [Pedobacter sp. MW01-1-1]|uniref:DUF2851 family protein n=1 Tax=Pedobacter sp. MW01-1-1 TaxID=3383027 RepID=UPI003FEE0AD8
MRFSEDFLQYVWQFRSFDFKELKTTNHEPLKILHSGFWNKDSGPDFSSAKIQIGNTIWAGNVEIHLRSSDWFRHHHQLDAGYENVILHVVFEHDAQINRLDGTVLPVLELKNKIPQTLIEKYENLFLSLVDFPCKSQIAGVDRLIIDSFLSRTLIERLEDKTKAVLETLTELRGSWDETFYRFIGRAFGFKVNANPFEQLARALPQVILAKHKNNALQIEALVFGTAGFLKATFQDEYPNTLKKEFNFLQRKYGIVPLEPSIWKFMRMRPQNFPTIRLAQFTGLILKSNHLFSVVLACTNLKDLPKLFEKLPINGYWENHYHFRKEGVGVALQIGKTSVDTILLNTVAVFLYAYGKHLANEEYIQRAVKLIESLPAEKNAIANKYANAGVSIENAFQSQAILQLKKHYCDQKKCLSCGIGIKILKQS